MNNAKHRINRLYKVLLFYWVILVLWQNLWHTVSRSGIDLVLKAALILWLLFEFLRFERFCRKKTFLLYLSLFVFFLLSYVFIEHSFQMSTVLIYAYPLLLVFLTFVLGESFKININELLFLCNGIIIVVVYTTIYALIFHRDQFAAALTAKQAYGNQLSSFFANSHEYALYLSGGIICCIIALRIKSREKSRVKILYWIALIMFLPCLLLTYSRTSMLGIACVFAVLVVFSKNNGIKKALIVGGILIALLIIFSEPIQSYITNIVLKQTRIPSTERTAGREYIYQKAFEYFRNGSITEILFGHGIEASRAFTEEKTTHTSVHNAYLQILLYYGVTGLIFMVTFCVTQIIGAIKLMKKDNFCGAMILAVVIMCIAVMFTNTAYIFFSSTDSYFLTLITIIVPKYVRNAINAGEFYVDRDGEPLTSQPDEPALQGGI